MCHKDLAKIDLYLCTSSYFFGAGFLSSLDLALLEGGAKLCIVAAIDDGLVEVAGTPLIPCDSAEGIRCGGGGYGCLLFDEVP